MRRELVGLLNLIQGCYRNIVDEYGLLAFLQLLYLMCPIYRSSLTSSVREIVTAFIVSETKRAPFEI